MNTVIPDLAEFQLERLGEALPVAEPNAEVSFKVEIEPGRVTRRIAIGILDDSGERGITIAIYPATGEICDLTNGGGVVGYLSQAPLSPGVPVPCNLTLSRFGKNFVCSVRVLGEIFLYPAFSMEGDTRLSAFVGQEMGGDDSEPVGWSDLHLDMLEGTVAA